MTWTLGGVFYLIAFDVASGPPRVDLDLPIPGKENRSARALSARFRTKAVRWEKLGRIFRPGRASSVDADACCESGRDATGRRSFPNLLLWARPPAAFTDRILRDRHETARRDPGVLGAAVSRNRPPPARTTIAVCSMPATSRTATVNCTTIPESRSRRPFPFAFSLRSRSAMTEGGRRASSRPCRSYGMSEVDPCMPESYSASCAVVNDFVCGTRPACDGTSSTGRLGLLSHQVCRIVRRYRLAPRRKGLR